MIPRLPPRLPPQLFTRSLSNSPYGRAHVWKNRPHKLPPPLVPQFPQRVVLADGSSYVHWTTSPRSSIRLSRDTTNSPIWNPWMEMGNLEELEGSTTGRLGRFRRKFEELGGISFKEEWMTLNTEGAEDASASTATSPKEPPAEKKAEPEQKGKPAAKK